MSRKINWYVLLIGILILAIGGSVYRIFLWQDTFPQYSLEHVLRNTKKSRNQALVKNLFALGAKVRAVKDLHPGSVADAHLRENLVFLTKICKDSCRAIRCRIDPGLGHACRINCPQKTVRFCSMAVKALPEEKR